MTRDYRAEYSAMLGPAQPTPRDPAAPSWWYDGDDPDADRTAQVAFFLGISPAPVFEYSIEVRCSRGHVIGRVSKFVRHGERSWRRDDLCRPECHDAWPTVAIRREITRLQRRPVDESAPWSGRAGRVRAGKK